MIRLCGSYSYRWQLSGSPLEILNMLYAIFDIVIQISFRLVTMNKELDRTLAHTPYQNLTNILQCA